MEYTTESIDEQTKSEGSSTPCMKIEKEKREEEKHKGKNKGRQKNKTEAFHSSFQSIVPHIK